MKAIALKYFGCAAIVAVWLSYYYHFKMSELDNTGYMDRTVVHLPTREEIILESETPDSVVLEPEMYMRIEDYSPNFEGREKKKSVIVVDKTDSDVIMRIDAGGDIYLGEKCISSDDRLMTFVGLTR